MLPSKQKTHTNVRTRILGGIHPHQRSQHTPTLQRLILFSLKRFAPIWAYKINFWALGWELRAFQNLPPNQVPSSVHPPLFLKVTLLYPRVKSVDKVSAVCADVGERNRKTFSSKWLRLQQVAQSLPIHVHVRLPCNSVGTSCTFQNLQFETLTYESHENEAIVKSPPNDCFSHKAILVTHHWCGISSTHNAKTTCVEAKLVIVNENPNREIRWITKGGTKEKERLCMRRRKTTLGRHSTYKTQERGFWRWRIRLEKKRKER